MAAEEDDRTVPGAIAEADRRWPDPEKGEPNRERFWPLKRGFRLGAAWAFRQPTDDARIEAARLAGAAEAFDAVQGYLRLVTHNMDPNSDKKWRDGVYALSGRLHHMMAEAGGQIQMEREVKLLTLGATEGPHGG